MKTSRCAFMLLTIAWTVACGSGVSEWPGLGHDLDNTFNNPHETKLTPSNADRLAPIWETKNFGSIMGAPAVADNVVYVQSLTGTSAVRASNGEQLWHNPNVTGTSSPTLNNGQLFVNDTAAMLHALNAKTGAELWRAKVDPHPQASGFSSPTVIDGYVIVGSASSDEVVNRTAVSTFRGSIVAFNRANGREVWRRYTVQPPFNGVGVWSSVAVDPSLGLVYGTTGNNYTGEAGDTSDSIFALRIHDGSVAWWTQLSKGDVFTVANPTSPDSDFGTSPILFNARINGFNRKLIAAGQKSGMFWALDRVTGSIVWSRNVSGGSAIIGGVFNNGAFDGTRLIIAGNKGTSEGPGSEPANNESIPVVVPLTSVLEALNPATGEVLWERQLPAWVWAPITLANGVGFAAYEKQLQAFDTKTGRKLFNFATNGTITSAPIVANGAVYFGSGMTYIIGYPDETLHALAVDGVRIGGDDPDAAVPDAGTSDAGDGGPLSPTFSAIYKQVLIGQGCAQIFCHGAAAGNLLMSSQSQAYQNMVGVTATGAGCAGSHLLRVDPGHPDSSLLLDKISHATPACGTVMPPGEAVTVPQAQIEQIRAWILAGAHND